MRPLINQIEILSGILLASFNCQYFSTYTRELLGCLLGEIPDGGGGGGNNIRQISNFLSKECLQTLVHAFVTSR